MNPSKSIWSDLPMETGIATLVCYAGVFRDVIGVEEMATRLGVAGQDKYYTALNELHRQGRIILREGFAGLPDLENKIDLKPKKIETTRQLIDSRATDLKKLGRNPFIKFVGISGSLAANNPTKDRNGILDLDVFLITRNQCIWLYVITSNTRNFFRRNKKDPVLCVNHIMDESNLRVPNRNFYTATEIRNLIPVSGLSAYRFFLQINNWVDYYYPDFSGPSAPAAFPPSGNLINKLSYIAYTVLRSMKHFSLEPLRKLTLKTNSHSTFNFNRLGARYGGYQVLVHNNFTRLASERFPGLVHLELVEKLFPDELSIKIRKGDIDNFEMHAVQAEGADFSKYGFQQILPKDR